MLIITIEELATFNRDHKRPRALSRLFHFFCNNNYYNNFLKHVQDACIPVITAIIESLYELVTDFKA